MWGRRGSRCSPGRIRTARMEHCRRSARGGIARRHAGGAAGRHGGAAQGAEARRVRPSFSKVSAVGVAGEGSRRLPLPGGCRARGGARPSGGDRTRVGDRGRRRSSARAGPGSVSSRRRLCTGVRRIVEFRQTSSCLSMKPLSEASEAYEPSRVQSPHRASRLRPRHAERRRCAAFMDKQELHLLSGGRGAESLPRRGRAGPGESYRQWRNSEVVNL